MGGAAMTYQPTGAAGGQRVTFSGTGGDLFGKFLLNFIPVVGGWMFRTEAQRWYWSNKTIDGQKCEFTAQWGEHLVARIVPAILTVITLGIYAPWAEVAVKKWEFERVLVNGQPGRVRYEGQGGELFMKRLVWGLLTAITFGIYAYWRVNNEWEYKWTHTMVDGRPLNYRKDISGTFVLFLVQSLLTQITCGIYALWAAATVCKYEADHVQ